MNKRHPYSQVVERKLEQLPGIDADHLWNGMQAILDKKMPQKKERRRFIPWFISGKGLFLFGVTSLVTISSFSLFFFSIRENSHRNIGDLSPMTKYSRSTSGVTSKVADNAKHEIQSGTEVSEVENGGGQATRISSSAVVANNIIGNNLSSPQRKRSDATFNGHKSNQDDQATKSVQLSTNIVVDVRYVALESGSATIKSKAETNFELNDGSLIALNFVKQKFPSTQQNKPAPDLNGSKEEKGWYAGIISGIDLSSIHFKSMKTGASKGLIMGYAFNNKWSIESGLLWDNKRFHDDGSYFSPAGYTPTSGIRIVAVNGSSRLYELPLNVRYVIIPQNHSLFATAGVSSYFMKREKYDYEYTQNNQPGGHNYLTYNNASKNWFSVLNISIGYAHKLGAIGSIRVEPYLKLPFKNLGVGNMPIMSTGLNVGFTRTLTR